MQRIANQKHNIISANRPENAKNSKPKAQYHQCK